MTVSLDLIFWIVATVIFGIAEGVTVAVVSIWFVVGSLVAVVLAALGVPVGFQVLAFAAVSAGTLMGFRRFIIKSDKKAELPKADDVVSQVGVVVEPIKPTQVGQVKVNGVVWSARGLDPDDSFETGERVIVCKREGIFCIVEKYDVV